MSRSATTDLQRRRGRSLRGSRCVASGPVGHWRIATLIGAMRLDGPLACATLEGPVDAATFLAWVHADLGPATAARRRGGDGDNLSAHKSPGIRVAIEATGARLLYLPPYSPDFNPIEPMWSKVKEALSIRRRPPHWKHWAMPSPAALRTVTADDCRGFFTYAKYDT